MADVSIPFADLKKQFDQLANESKRQIDALSSLLTQQVHRTDQLSDEIKAMKVQKKFEHSLRSSNLTRMLELLQSNEGRLIDVNCPDLQNELSPLLVVCSQPITDDEASHAVQSQLLQILLSRGADLD